MINFWSLYLHNISIVSYILHHDTVSHDIFYVSCDSSSVSCDSSSMTCVSSNVSCDSSSVSCELGI